MWGSKVCGLARFARTQLSRLFRYRKHAVKDLQKCYGHRRGGYCTVPYFPSLSPRMKKWGKLNEILIINSGKKDRQFSSPTGKASHLWAFSFPLSIPSEIVIASLPLRKTESAKNMAVPRTALALLLQGAPQDGVIKKGGSKMLDRLILYIKQPSYVEFSTEIRGRYRFRTQISVQNVFLNINNL